MMIPIGGACGDAAQSPGAIGGHAAGAGRHSNCRRRQTRRRHALAEEAEADKASTDQKDVAQLAADQAAQDAAEAADRLTRALANLSPGGVEKLAGSMEPFDPDATALRA